MANVNATTAYVLGVRIANLTQGEAIEQIEGVLRSGDGVSHGLFIVNAHTLNLAFEDHDYRSILNDGYAVYGDGTGVRWAARARGVRMRDNLVGTDLVPALFEQTAGRKYRYFLLGSSAETIERAAAYAERKFPGWDLAGYHHGYVIDDSAAAIAKINEARPHVLLVGMGNPLQERWIHDHLHELRVPLSIGVGGLFDHWGGTLERAPLWVRRLGVEWLQILLQQPHKWRRYLIGNWTFLARVPREPTEISAPGPALG
ncbi:MAG: WecB/TagA/CpsF family glycosyltransferase [Myxococcales bacterium]|nr:MAG: WecB/TagA/CpsF family glycosyltransferase [Myxococcales bacterium]